MSRVRAPPPASPPSGARTTLFSIVKTEQRQEAVRLRRQGLSMREIERRVGVSRATVSRWVAEIELDDRARIELLARGASARTRARSSYYRARRRRFQEEGRELARRGEALHAAGCMLFWAEGSRHRNTVQLANSDPELIAFFAGFLRRYFAPPDSEFRIACNLFADHEERRREIEDFWLATARLPRSCLTKSTVNMYSRASKRTRINKLPYGTCRLTLHSTRVAQHLHGAIQEYGGFERPEWLD
ncbi:MAG TPA: helix-turn-helix domain-containing protein [Gaiellaceae bacterium]|nr:helix-turn-helix domain-containing protein [Gaiellaceae bacterium]